MRDTADMGIDIDSYEHVRLSLDHRGILTATITNPAKKSALNAGISGDLDRLWRDIDRITRCASSYCRATRRLFAPGWTSVLSQRDMKRPPPAVAAAKPCPRLSGIGCSTSLTARLRRSLRSASLVSRVMANPDQFHLWSSWREIQAEVRASSFVPRRAMDMGSTSVTPAPSNRESAASRSSSLPASSAGPPSRSSRAA